MDDPTTIDPDEAAWEPTTAAAAADEDEFERMLREMSEELGDSDDDDMPTDDGEDDDEPGGLDPDLEATVLVSPAPAPAAPLAPTAPPAPAALPAEPAPPQPFLFGPDDLLTVNYVVQVSLGGSGFVETDARGLLSGNRSYPVTALDDFAFGFDAMRNDYEIVLDPNSLGYGLRELPTGTRWELGLDEAGALFLDKPAGLRVSVHRIVRDAAGGQSVTPLCDVGPETPDKIALPIDLGDEPPEHAEFMVGMGLADTEPPSFAFSVYLAVRLGG